MTYPARDNHFAHKTFRMMHKASVAAEIGRDAFCIVAVILHTEDAARYRGPVSFYNSQLMETLGFAKWETFDKARQRAIDSGWLAYTGFGNRKPGMYHVTVPPEYAVVEDGLMEPSYPENGYNLGYKDGYNQGYKDGYNQDRHIQETDTTRGITGGTTMESLGGQLGVQPGGSSYPTPNPNPNPNPISCSEVKTPSEQAVQIFEVNTDAVTEPEPAKCRFPVFPCAGKPGTRTWEATSEQRDQWADAFPGLNVEQELRRAHVWVMSNLEKKKTAKGMPRFLFHWLSKAQNSGNRSNNFQKPKPQQEHWDDLGIPLQRAKP